MEIVLLGSTGSIGTQTAEVCKAHDIKIKALSANKNIKLLEAQAREFKPEYAAVYDESLFSSLKTSLADTGVKVLCGIEGLCEAAALSCDRVVNSVIGMVGLRPTLSAIEAGNDIALANKETLAAGGELVMRAAAKKGVSIIPIDSEHSAIFQCLLGAGDNKPEKIILTASGGPFFGKKREELKNISKEQALSHPNWSMGAKITVDSATMMNKGLELIEAVRLFDISPEKIEIVVHRQSVVHSAVEFADGAIMAQLGTADMKIPIQLALTYPKRLSCEAKKLSLSDVGSLTFEKPDEETFVCLKAAREAVKKGGNAPCAVNCANEAAVSLFLNGEIGFLDIFDIVEEAAKNVGFIKDPSIEDILETQTEAENFAIKRKK